MPVTNDWLNIEERDSHIRSRYSRRSLAGILSYPVAFDLQSIDKSKKRLLAGVNFGDIEESSIANINILNCLTETWATFNKECAEFLSNFALIVRLLHTELEFMYNRLIRVLNRIKTFQVLRSSPEKLLKALL